METLIPWNEGGGSILADYGGQGSGPLHLSSTTENEGEDRCNVIQVAALGSPLDVEVTVRQTGRRERMAAAQTGHPEFHTAEGPFLVLK